MKSAGEFLSQIERNGTSMSSLPLPTLNHRCNSTVPIEVIGASILFKWRLFPVLPRGSFAAQKALLENATSNQAQLEQWAVDYPGCSLALATGEASGVFTIEMKGELGRNALHLLSWDDWDWRECTLLMSAGDTGHAFFRWPAGLSLHKACKQIAPGLNLRGEKDFVLIPPAVVSGISREWINPDVAVAEAPQKILNRILALSEGQASGKNILRLPKPQRAAPFAPSAGLEGTHDQG